MFQIPMLRQCLRPPRAGRWKVDPVPANRPLSKTMTGRLLSPQASHDLQAQVAAALLLAELKAENHFYNLKHESPLQALGDLREHLEKAAKIGKHVPYAKPLADVLERLGVLISVVKAERGLASNTGPGQLKGLGNALLALGALMPPELGGPLVSSAGQYLSNAANAVAYLDQQVGAQNYNSWIGGKGSGSHDGSDIPFSPQWANTVLSENGQGLPSFSQAYQNFENNGQGYCYH